MGRTKRIYLFNESHLPDGGWLQMCLRCDTITGGLLLFRVDQVEEHLLEYRVHLCSGCRRIVERICWRSATRRAADSMAALAVWLVTG